MKVFLAAILLSILSLILPAQPTTGNGIWHAELSLNDTTELPFLIESGTGGLVIRNGAERIGLNEITQKDDSLFIRFPVFDSEIRATVMGPVMMGVFINHARSSQNELPFRAVEGMNFRFNQQPEAPYGSVDGRWDITYEGTTGIDHHGVLLLKQVNNTISGTVLLASGDHRYLDGELSGDHLQLSSFNGFHAFLYEGRLQKDGTLRGHFFSGSLFHDTWTAKRNPGASLIATDSLTRLKPGAGPFNFSFPDSAGKIWTMNDPSLKGKIVIVQVMGTWCPNCIDEAEYLNDLYARRKKDGIEVIALDYERTTEMARGWNNIRRFIENKKITYPVVYGGSSNRDSSSATLPAIERIHAYPTTLVIDRKGNVKKIFTGFSGPATGEEFVRYKETFETLLDELAKQK